MSNAIYREHTRFSSTMQMVCVECYKCHVLFAMTKEQNDRCRETGSEFYCTNGHCQAYITSENTKLKQEAERLQRQLDTEKSWHRSTQGELEREKRKRAAQKANVTKLKKRVAHGVCPCCTRTFQNLARHMKTKHPEFVDIQEAQV